MTNPKAIGDALVTAMRAIPGLVTAMTGLQGQISFYGDSFPQSSQLWQAINDLAPPAMLVVWNGTALTGDGRRWLHEFAVIVRAKPETATATGYTDIWTAFVNGVPSGYGGQPLQFTEVIAGVFRMEPPSIRRMSIPVNERDSLDYFEITVRFVEKQA